MLSGERLGEPGIDGRMGKEFVDVGIPLTIGGNVREDSTATSSKRAVVLVRDLRVTG